MIEKLVFWTATIIAMMIITVGEARAEAMPQVNTLIEFNPVACPNKSICNAYHIRYVKSNGVVEFERDFPSNTMASKAGIVIHTEKGTLYIWSDR